MFAEMFAATCCSLIASNFNRRTRRNGFNSRASVIATCGFGTEPMSLSKTHATKRNEEKRYETQTELFHSHILFI